MKRNYKHDCTVLLNKMLDEDIIENHQYIALEGLLDRCSESIDLRCIEFLFQRIVDDFHASLDH